MTGQKHLISLFGNGHRDNIGFTINATDEVVLHFNSSGGNTATDKFFNLRQAAKKVHIIVNKVATIIKINNQTLTTPMTLGTDVANVFREGIEWGTITVAADSNATTFETYAS